MFQKSSILFVVVFISGCIGYPASDKVSEFIHTGLAPGNGLVTGNNPDEFIIEETYERGMQWLLSPEGPRRMVHGGPRNYTYHLQKKNNKKEISYLSASSNNDRWDQFINLDGLWFAFNYHVGGNVIRIVQFDGDTIWQDDSVNLILSGNRAKLYLHKDRKYILWKSQGGPLYKYTFSNSLSEKILTDSFDILSPKNVIMLPEYFTGYDDTDFITEVETYKQYDKANGFYTRAMIAYTTKRINTLEKYCDSGLYIVRWGVAENPATPKYLLRQLSRDESDYVSAAAKKRLNSE